MPNCVYIRVILELNITFGQELVVLPTTISMLGKFPVPAWREYGRLNKIHSLLFMGNQTHFGILKVLKMSLDLMDRDKLLFVQIQTIPLSMHHKWKDIVCKATNEKS